MTAATDWRPGLGCEPGIETFPCTGENIGTAHREPRFRGVYDVELNAVCPGIYFMENIAHFREQAEDGMAVRRERVAAFE